ncbi:metal ABC transporter solute-binding protein, Zn/Mn family [Demequina sp. NBRC 110053]|uniref:metal ABC transporter substrate-binding protein n=1 Tax=Demequina sp. NBRC 110053 TaxID=1570342 RepID=UPI001185B381|nr:zinc ABC transporter substrate-binding protein [Demequina sp. NBRC 110053]
MLRTPLILAGCAVGAFLAAGCSPAGSTDDASGSTDAALTVGASLYPLQFVAERVGGDSVEVVSLIATGVEPHDAEISPAMVRQMQSMDTVLTLSDFSAAVDEAVDATGVRAVDAHAVVDEHGPEVAHHAEESHATDGHDHEDEDHAHEDEDSHEGHDHGALDPHFWTDPSIFAEFVPAVVAEYSELDPDNAQAYADNGDRLVAQLTELDDAFSEGLATCERREIFVSHEAYGYLAMHHDLVQEGLSGLDPEAEPSPARVREIRDQIAGTGATTIFTESLVSSAVAESLASDLGVTTDVLDPIESAVDGDDYIAIQERNLDAMRSGLGCA